MKPEGMTIVERNEGEAEPETLAIRARRAEFIELRDLYVARRAPDEIGPKFIMELNADDVTLLLAGLSALLPDKLKLVQGDMEIDAETAARIHALGDSAREMLIRATTESQHNHVWSCLINLLSPDMLGPDPLSSATQTAQAATVYMDRLRDELDMLERAGLPEASDVGK